MAEEVLGSPPDVAVFTKNVLNSLGIYLKCRKGRGPYLSSQSFPRRIALLWNYVRYLTLGRVFRTNNPVTESVDFKLYFHVDIAKIRLTRYF